MQNRKKNKFNKEWVRCPVYGNDCSITKKHGKCHHKKKQQANAAVADVAAQPANEVNSTRLVEKLKNVQKENANLVAKQTRVRAAMVATGLTAKEQQFGMVAICKAA